MKIKVKYRRARFTVEAARPRTCQCCGKRRQMQLHHWRYAYKTSEVRKDKQLALDNTSWLCFRCHVLADAMRTFTNMDDETWEKLYNLKYGREVKHAETENA